MLSSIDNISNTRNYDINLTFECHLNVKHNFVIYKGITKHK